MIKIAYDSLYCHSLPDGHRFPMQKYELIPLQLLRSGIITEENLFQPDEVEERWISLAHESDYWQRLKAGALSAAEIRRIGFPLSDALVHRERVIANGTLMCTDYALQSGISFNVAGGTHHAGKNWGEGFCLLNDMAIAAHYLLATKKAERIVMIDLDVHQGNGTADIFKNDNRVFTLSIHGEKNFPFIKEKSNLDYGLPDGLSDAAYLAVLEQTIPNVLEAYNPDFVFYQSGVDILETDKLGKIKVSAKGCAERDRFVFACCKAKSLPMVVTMGGGYSERLADIVDAHCETFRIGMEVYGN